MIVLSSILWGTALLYSQYVLDHGLNSKDAVSLKMGFGFITMLIYILMKDRSLLKIDKRGGFIIALQLVASAMHSTTSLCFLQLKELP